MTKYNGIDFEKEHSKLPQPAPSDYTPGISIPKHRTSAHVITRTMKRKTSKYTPASPSLPALDLPSSQRKKSSLHLPSSKHVKRRVTNFTKTVDESETIDSSSGRGKYRNPSILHSRNILLRGSFDLLWSVVSGGLCWERAKWSGLRGVRTKWGRAKVEREERDGEGEECGKELC